MSGRKPDSEIASQAFRQAELRSECTRIAALLTLFGSLLALVLIRALISLAEGRHGEAWPFVLLLAGMTAYEVVWLRFIRATLNSNREVSSATWTAAVFVESLLPTVALFLEVHTSWIGPHRTLTSPVSLAYFLFITLSTLHLNPGLSRLAGVFSAGGYAVVAIYVLLLYPVAGTERLLVYTTSLSYTAFLLLGGFAAGVVAVEIRLYVLAALREAESQSKIAALEHDLGLARSIQQALLPKEPPAIAGFDVAGWNQPADETGGDYFDWQPLDDRRIAVTIADVTGHGISSALGMTGCRAYARAGFAMVPDLQSFLGRLNHLLYADLPSDKFVTMAAGLLNPDDSTLQLISAGHGPLLFYSSAEDRFINHEAQGPPLGLLPGIGYGDSQTIRFAPGDILVLVTDGFIEWENANREDFGQSRLEEIIRTCRDLPSDAIISRLYSAVAQFAGSTPQGDDLTALVVKRAQ
jgi:serine phosphatase RsbU (regulator of sigma subunit)